MRFLENKLEKFIKFCLLLFGVTFAVAAVPLLAQANIAYVQRQEATSMVNTNTVNTGLFGGAVSSGNLMVCWLYYNSNSQTVLSMSDSGGNTYLSAIGATTGINAQTGWRSEIRYAYNITGAGFFSVTATFTGNINAEKNIICHEYSGALTTADPKNVTDTYVANAADISSGVVTTTQAGEMIFSTNTVSGGSFPGSGFAWRSNSNFNVSEDKIAWAPGPHRAYFNQYAEDSIVQTVTFKPASVTFPSGIYIWQDQRSETTGAGLAPNASVAFDTINVTGNLIVAAIRLSGVGRTLTVSDSAGNIYTQAAYKEQSVDGHTIAIYYAQNIAGVANTVSLSATGPANCQTVALYVYEFSGIARSGALDKTSINEGANASADSGSTAVTTSANELLFGLVGLAGSISPPYAPGGTFTYLDAGLNGAGLLHSAVSYRVVSSTGAYSTTSALSGADNWSAMIATFKGLVKVKRVVHSN